MMVILFSAAMALQIPAVQTSLVSRVVGKLTAGMNGQINTGQVKFLPFNTVILENVAVIDGGAGRKDGDETPDTVFRADFVAARLTLGGLLGPDVMKLRKVEVRNGCFNLAIEDNEYKNNISRVFGLHPSGKNKSLRSFLIRKIDIRDFTFRMVNDKKIGNGRYEHGIKWDDLELTADIKGKNLKIADGIISGVLEHGELYEKSGFTAEDISGKARVGNGMVRIDGLHIRDIHSDLNVDNLTLSFEDNHSFKNFIDEVRMDGCFNSSKLAIETISYFAPALHGNPLVVEIASGEVHGYVSDMSINSLNFSQEGSGVSAELEGTLSGLPDISRFLIDCNVRKLNFTTRGLGQFISCWTGGKKVDLSKFASSERFTYRGRVKGLLSDLCMKGRLASTAGSLETDIDISNIVGGIGPIGIDGDIQAEDLDLGRITGVGAIHECSLGSRMKVSLGKNDLQATIDSLNISRLNVLGYDYSNIKAAGTFSQSAFNGRIICNDPNINFLFQGLFNLSRKTNNARYRFFASLGYADLHALKIDPREVSRVSLGSLNADYTRVTKGDLIGTINASDLVLEGVNGRHPIGDIHVDSHANNNRNSIDLSSSFVDGSFTGNGSVLDFIKDLQELTVKKEIPALFSSVSSWRGKQYEMSFDFHDSRDLLSFIAPGAYIADSTAIRLDISRNADLRGSIKSPRIAFKDKYLKGLDLQMNNNEDALNCTITSDEASISRKIKLKNDAIMLYANDNKVGAGINFNNMTEIENRGEMYVTGDFSDSQPGSLDIKAKSLTSNIYFNGEQWRINPAEYEFAGKQIKLSNLVISNNDQRIIINGGISPESADSLNVNLSSVRLGIINDIMDSGLDIQGTASGRILLTSPTKDNLGLLMNLTSEETSISGYEAGTLRIGSTYDDTANRLNLILRNILDGKSTIDSRISYTLNDKSLDVNAELDGFELGYASSFLTSVFDRIDGKLNGRVSVSGPADALDIRSEDLRVNNGSLTLNFTKVPYFMDGPLHIDNNGVHFDNIAIRDAFRGTGSVNGGILFDRFRNIRMDTSVRLENMEGLRTSARDNSSFYGSVYGTGRVSISGAFNSLLLDIDASTVNDGAFHLPLSFSGNAKGSDLLSFKEAEKIVYIDPYELMMQDLNPQIKQQNDMEVKLRISAHPGVEAIIDIGNEGSNRLNGYGAGTISLDVRPSKDIFTINGDYTLSSGDVHFNVLNIANKDFSILNGSSIKFNGDIMDSDLDIDAQYNIKTSLGNLIADTTSVSTRRNVECGISISDKLRNPKLDFSINIPDLDPTTKSRVESALSTDDKVQKQFIALLVTNNFLPDEQSGIVNNSNILASNVADIMANQLNSILQKLDIPLDLGLKYQSNDSGNNLFDVALSTQLFNNRVSVNGNIGNRQYNRSSTDEDVVGDLDIEIKMGKSGQVRMNLFSHSADQYTNYLDNSQRNGVGVAYQKEFDSLREFVRNIFMSKEKRQQMEIESNMKDVEKVTINVE